MDLDKILENLKKCILPTENDLFLILKSLNILHYDEPNTLELSGSFTLVGDLHGQYFDLLNLFDLNGWPSESRNYVFLGDYVDRGAHSVEIFILLSVIKLKYSDSVFLLRGNHETENLNSVYGFKKEVLNKYNLVFYKLFCESMQFMAICALITVCDKNCGCTGCEGILNESYSEKNNSFPKNNNILIDESCEDIFAAKNLPGKSMNTKNLNGCDICKGLSNSNTENKFKVFAVHGGLSPKYDQINQINKFNRMLNHSNLHDLLWSDPSEEPGYKKNTRGAGYLFGEDIVNKFCKNNNISLIVRSHQLVQDGFELKFDGKLANIWSAPNYCYMCGNLASVIVLKKGGFEEIIYDKCDNQLGNNIIC
ncbi:serine/threonine-protein phosphatase [Hamiltosporidium tvaerminnensis]|uniref:Serine/threonine-protein phosphatase n=2 Tax=Hamiltosporidium tvaerminnensis TaxID=1176355 RepID=A0A4Q9LLF0_9MICR|nr:serine/threonine-protein phosphatase [Hamiltosporidium tvaerminnensis]